MARFRLHDLQTVPGRETGPTPEGANFSHARPCASPFTRHSHPCRILSIFAMVKLPNAHLALVSDSKLSDYLLSPSHPDGQAKHDFFAQFGFSLSDPDRLRRALLEHALSYELASIEETLFGRRYVIEGPLRSPDGRQPWIRAVWFVDSGNTIPRLVTAYPRPEGD